MNQQHPIPTDFTAASTDTTASDVLAGLDLTGREIIVTAAKAGSAARSADPSPPPGPR